MKAHENERGIALVVVLWVGLLIAAIAGAFILDTRTSTQLTRNFLDNAEARALADGGIHLAIYELLRSDGEAEWHRDGRLYRRAVPGGVLDIAVEDEAGKIDINKARRELLQGVFRSAGLTDGEARAIAEGVEKFRGGEELHETLLQSAGVSNDQIKALADAIRAAGSSGRPDRSSIGRGVSAGAQGIFNSVDSLGLVPGITPALHARLRPALTVYGAEDVFYLSAPREALLAIPDMPSEAVDIFMVERMGGDPTSALNDFLLQGRARDYWRDDPSRFVTVKVMARSENGAKFTRVAIVEIREAGRTAFVIKEWREGDSMSLRPPVPVRDGARALSRGAS